VRVDVGVGRGTLKVLNRNGDHSLSLQFNPQTIQNWYPYNTAYKYQLNPEGEIILTEETGIRVYPSKIEGEHYLNSNLWYNKVVRDDNCRISQFAQKMGVCSPFTPYSVADVNRGLNIVGTTIDNMSKHYTLKYVAEQQKNYTQNSDSEALRALPDEIKHLYTCVGEVYTMLNTMRKVVNTNGFGRPVEPPVWGTYTRR